MRAVVVYESLWGNTAAIAEAIVAGLGSGAIARRTTDATSDLLEGIDLVVAGAPVHMMTLPKLKTRESALRRGALPGAIPPDLSGQMMRDWLARLGPGSGSAAAFDTRIASQVGGASGARILRKLRRAGYHAITPPETFIVERFPEPADSGVRLAEGELQRARDWGVYLTTLCG